MSPFPLGAGQKITADDLNAILPQGMVAGTYTPVLTALTTNPTLGAGAVQVGRFYRLGRLLVCHARIQFGTSGTGAGSGEYRVSLPQNLSAGMAAQPFRLGTGTAYDASTNGYYVITACATGANADRLLFLPDSAGVVGSSTPFTWAANDRLDFFCFYEPV